VRETDKNACVAPESRPIILIGRRENPSHGNSKGSGSTNRSLHRPETGDAKASLVLLLFHGIRILLDHFDSLRALSLGHFAKWLQSAFFLFILKPYAGPMLAAIIMTSTTEGKAGLLRLRHRRTQWRAGWIDLPSRRHQS
jgi:hypothetical protein